MATGPYEYGTSDLSARLTPEELEMARRQRALELNKHSGSGAELEARHGRIWSPDELARDFEVIGFAAPYVVVRRRSDGTMGSLEFQHHPRFYFNFEADQPA